MQNAYQAYELMLQLDPLSVKDLLEAHRLMMNGLVPENGKFIHPFTDGNCRMGRMWHSLLLGRWKELFYWLPIEELIRTRQKEYYDALGAADKQADIAGFVDLMLRIIGDSTLSASELMARLGLSHKPTFRKNYLNPALEQNLIERTIPDKPNSRNQKYIRRVREHGDFP